MSPVGPKANLGGSSRFALGSFWSVRGLHRSGSSFEGRNPKFSWGQFKNRGALRPLLLG
jgi:hypothetical protein